LDLRHERAKASNACDDVTGGAIEPRLQEQRPGAAGEIFARRTERLERLAIDVCICTYHRPSVLDVLAAVAAQEGSDTMAVRVIVADNAALPDARAAICARGSALGLDLVYVHAPAKNISIARNACLAAASGDWIAFLDDDERPSPIWLLELIAEARRGGWDAVLGPVQALYPAQTPRWLRAGDFHSTRPVWVRGGIETGYTGNVLLRRQLIARTGLAFRVEFGRSGGEDIDFFYRFRDTGGRIGFAPGALIHEPVPAERTCLRYLLRRNFRQGQSHARRLQQRPLRGLGLLLHLQIAFAKALILALAAALQLGTVPRIRFLTRAALHCGVIARLAGFSEIKLY
jgi:succinoglycan biosynthesis protein ExoM